MRGPATLLLVLTLAGVASARDPATAVYEHSCAWCHGRDGRGDGPAAFSIGKYRSPLPRDFTRGRFEFRSTPSGTLPTDEDLLRTVEHGIPGFMPSFQGLTAGERRLAITAVKRFYPGFADARPTPITIPPAPVADAAAVERGRQAYEEAGCPACHGDRGHGDGPSAGGLRDDRGLPIRPADLRYPSRFKGGAEPSDLYRTLVTGLDGTPMPSYASAYDDPAMLWDLVAYVRSLKRRPLFQR
jgi:mono/diheme cytochrome c family protein